MLKTCTKCAEAKQLEEFSRHHTGAGGINARCKACVREYAREVYHRKFKQNFDTGEITVTCKNCYEPFTYVKTTGQRRFYCSERCKREVVDKQRISRNQRRCTCGSENVGPTNKPVCQNCKKDKRKRSQEARVRKLKMYGLTPEDYDWLVAQQQGRCAICGSDDPGYSDRRVWHIDHDHGCCPGVGSCGECVRGLLCHCCNLMLGNAKDSVQRLELAKQYLIGRASKPLRAVQNG